jgi:hypothetical protein
LATEPFEWVRKLANPLSVLCSNLSAMFDGTIRPRDLAVQISIAAQLRLLEQRIYCQPNSMTFG